MTTNLYIGYPDIPFRATATETGTSEFSGQLGLLEFGGKAQIYRLYYSLYGRNDILYDLGSGVTQSANYLALGRAKLLKQSGVASVALRGGSVSYTLPSSSNLKINLDAGQRVTADGSMNVSDWNDTTILFTQSTGANKPVWQALDSNGNRSLLFDGTNDNFTSASLLSDIITNSAYTVFAVVKPQAKATDNSIISDANGFFRFGYGNADNKFFIHNDAGSGGVRSLSTVAAVDQVHIVEARHESGNLYCSVNGGAESAVASGNTVNLTGYLEVGTAAGGNPYKGYIYKILVYNTVLSSGDRSNIRTLLANEWTDTPIYVTNSLQSATLPGPNAEDYMTKFSASTAYRYWRLSFDSGLTSSKRPVSKAFFGTLFDFGRDPEVPVTITKGGDATKDVYQPLRFSLTWQGISNTLRQSFESKIGKYIGEHTYFLYQDSYDYALGGHDPLYCRIENYTVTPEEAQMNAITVDFEEVYR